MTRLVNPSLPKNSDPSIHSEDSLSQPTAISLGGIKSVDEITRGQVKWFNIEKGYGFIVPEKNPRDAFIHISVLKRHGLDSIGSGTTVTFMMRPGRGGPEVSELLEIDESTAIEQPREQEVRSEEEIESLIPQANIIEGYVKWFNPSKGYGFIVPSDGSQDIFIHISLLRRHGLDNLIADQKLSVFAIDGPKGPEALKISQIHHT